MWSTVVYPSATSYPDSDKIGVWTGFKPEDVMVERSSNVEYYDGETAGEDPDMGTPRAALHAPVVGSEEYSSGSRTTHGVRKSEAQGRRVTPPGALAPGASGPPRFVPSGRRAATD